MRRASLRQPWRIARALPSRRAGRRGADPNAGYRLTTRLAHSKDNRVILAFSGGGTRAAAFSYGVLEFLRETEVTTRTGNRIRLLDEVDVITGVSGGSFTALAYGLYGDNLFADYEQRFLKRDVQGEIQADNQLNSSIRQPSGCFAGGDFQPSVRGTGPAAKVDELLHEDPFAICGSA